MTTSATGRLGAALVLALIAGAACRGATAEADGSSREDPSMERESDVFTPLATTTPMEARVDELLAEYSKWEGTPYREGGTSSNGIDCSGYTKAIYQAVFGVELPRTAQGQEGFGVEVGNSAELQPGDLVFFRTKGFGPFMKRRHVGIYLGDRLFTHASSSQGVTISRLDDGYWRTAHKGSRRVLESGD